MSGAGFLGRWSRRKQAAARPVVPDAAAASTPPGPDAARGEAVGPALAPAPQAMAVGTRIHHGFAPALAPAPQATAPLPARAGQETGGSPMVLSRPAPPLLAKPNVVPDAAAGVFDAATLPALESLTAASDLRGFLRSEVPAALRQAALRRAWTLDPAISQFIGPADYAWDFNAPDGITGFALSMPGDLGRMLAQATGLADPAEGIAGTDRLLATASSQQSASTPSVGATDAAEIGLPAGVTDRDAPERVAQTMPDDGPEALGSPAVPVPDAVGTLLKQDPTPFGESVAPGQGRDQPSARHGGAAPV